MNRHSWVGRRLRLFWISALLLLVAFTGRPSGSGNPPNLIATTTVTRPGQNIVGTGAAVGAGGIYFSAALTPGGADTGEGVAGRFAVPLTSGAAPAWQRTWPGAAGFDTFMGVDAGSAGAYYAGASFSQTTDAVGGKERKEIVATFNLDGSDGADTAGAVWVARQRFYPLSNGYDGDEFVSMLDRPGWSSGSTFVYGAGRAQPGSCNSGYAIRKTASGGAVWQWQYPAAGCGGSELNAIVVNGSSVYAAGFSADAGGVPQILEFNAAAGGSGPIHTFSGTHEGYASAAYTSAAIYGGNIWAAGYLSNGEQQAYLLDAWTPGGTLVVHQIWSSDPARPNGQQLMGITSVGSRLFVVGYTRNTDNPAVAHSLGGATVPVFADNASLHGFADGVIFEVNPSDGSVVSTTSYGTNDGNDQAFTGVTTDGTDLYVTGAQRSGGVYQALVQRYGLGPAATTLTVPAATGTFGGTTTLQATL
jgi:hypothetical protein